MKNDFNENTMIVIPFIYKGYRLSDGEKVRFRCMFKRKDGDLLCEHNIIEDNSKDTGPDGRYTITIDTTEMGILPGRYHYSLDLVLPSGVMLTIKTCDETEINIVPVPHYEERDKVE